VEVALLLPFVVLLAMIVAQLGLVVRDQVLVVHAAREGARAAAVEPSTEAVIAAVHGATRLDPARIRVTVSGRAGPGSLVTVRVSYRAPTDLPLAGRLVGDVELVEEATMRVEE
jgi:Flp pilus assembly protein TadG